MGRIADGLRRIERCYWRTDLDSLATFLRTRERPLIGREHGDVLSMGRTAACLLDHRIQATLRQLFRQTALRAALSKRV